jgi:hypothetical protein
MGAPSTAPALLADFARRGFTLRAASGRLSVSPASALTAADREAVRQRRDELLALLARAEPWDLPTALRLMHDADSLVEQLGVSGRHPAVAAAAATVASALTTRDMETLRFAVAEFAAVVRELARKQSPPARDDHRP